MAFLVGTVFAIRPRAANFRFFVLDDPGEPNQVISVEVVSEQAQYVVNEIVRRIGALTATLGGDSAVDILSE